MWPENTNHPNRLLLRVGGELRPVKRAVLRAKIEGKINDDNWADRPEQHAGDGPR
jgi:hypothetical protein